MASSSSGQEIPQPGDALFQFGLLDRISQPNMMSRTVRAEIDTRSESNTRAFERVTAKPLAIVAKRRAIGVDEEAPGRHHRHGETELAQRGDDEIAPGFEDATSMFDDFDGVGFETRERL